MSVNREDQPININLYKSLKSGLGNVQDYKNKCNVGGPGDEHDTFFQINSSAIHEAE